MSGGGGEEERMRVEGEEERVRVEGEEEDRVREEEGGQSEGGGGRGKREGEWRRTEGG